MATPIIQQVLAQLETEVMKNQLKSALPPKVDVDRFVRTTRTYIQDIFVNNPKMASCEPKAIFSGIMKGAQWGLEFGSGQVHISPKGRACQFTIGYQGYIAIMRRKLDLDVITVETVYENDKFEFKHGTKPFLNHSWNFSADRGKIIGFYCFTRFMNGSESWTTMDAVKMDAFAKEHGGFLWGKAPEQMRKKTMIRQHAKYLGLEPELDQALSNGDEQILHGDKKVSWPDVTEPDSMRTT